MTGSRSRILVVDDNPATLYATSRILRSADFEVQQAETGQAAIRIATTQPIDVIVLDINLPDMDGYEVCRQVRVVPSSSSIRVVHLSASFIDDIHRVAGYEAGADAFLTHPVEPTVLVATIRALLRTKAVERQLEELLVRERESRAEAERANRAKDEFLATLSHELRSPLNAIIGWAEVARMRTDSEEVQAALRVIVRNARFQTQLISDLLDVSRITLGKLTLEKEAVDLAEVMTSTIDSMRAIAADAHIQIESNVASDIGLLEADPVRLQQMISNLLGNAIKFSEKSGVIRITAHRDDSTAVITVTDQGRGIDQAALPLLFDRFWQEDTTSRRTHSGLGLGLAIVQHLAQMHGGQVTAYSAGLGQGATFTITLPIMTGSATTPSSQRAHSSGTDSDLRGLRILIVDDDEDSRLWVKRIVCDAGGEALEVADVGSALAAVEEFRPDVLVSDLAMPVQDGFDLLGVLRTRGHSPELLPAIALSAFAGADHRQRALAASYATFLSKPPEPHELLAAVASLGGARKQHVPGEYHALGGPGTPRP